MSERKSYGVNTTELCDVKKQFLKLVKCGTIPYGTDVVNVCLDSLGSFMLLKIDLSMVRNSKRYKARYSGNLPAITQTHRATNQAS